MARKSKSAENAVDAAMESRVEEIKTEDKAAETGTTEEKTTEEKAVKKTRAGRKPSAKTSASKEEAVKAEKKESVKTPAKRTTKKKETVCSMTVQYGGRELSEAELLNTVKSIWKSELKRKAGDLNSVELYIKPEENKVYYVVNKDVTGSFDI